MEYIDQSVKDIRLYLVTGEPQLAQFAVLSQLTVPWGDASLTYGILGASHYVSVARAERTFTEICACVEGTFVAPTRVELSSPICELPSETTFHSDGLTHTLSYEIFDHRHLDTRIESLKTAHTRVTSHIFPRHEASAAEDPITILGLTPGERTLAITSIHSYPNEGRFIETKSSFTVT